MPVHNDEIAAAFDEIAELLSLSGENQFRIRAYRRAAQTLRALPDDLAARLASGFDPDRLPGIGTDLAGKIREFVATGRCKSLEALRRSVPAGLRELLALPDIGPQRARALYEALGIHDLADLRAALDQQRIRLVPHFGARLEERLKKSLEARGERSHRILWSVADGYAQGLRRFLAAIPGVAQVEVAGSYRRGRDTVGDLDLVVAARAGVDVDRALRGYDEVASVLASGRTRSSVVLRSGLQVDVRVVPPASFGAALYYFTGSKAHNIRLRTIAVARGLKVNEYGVYRGRSRIAGETEESVLAAVGLPYIAPELREDRGEFDAAAARRLPDLVTLAQIRGDLHAHTRATDGTASLEDMVAAARRAGLRYLAITDHSKYLGAVHGLDATGLSRQIDQIEALAQRTRGISVLKGIEVDVLEDGSLALPDPALARLDLVVGAVHSQFGLSRKQQTDRLLRALDRPYLSVLAHPTARLIEQRPPIDCDWRLVFRRAAERPCLLELNAQPARLDLDDILAREAAANGVLISLASDAHRTEDFALLEGGVRQARRAWLSAAAIANTRPIGELRRLLRRTFLK